MRIRDAFLPFHWLLGGRDADIRDDGRDSRRARAKEADGFQVQPTSPLARPDATDPATALHPHDRIAGRSVAETIAELTGDDPDIARTALTAIYEAYFERLWRFAYGKLHSTELAKDVTQDLFLSLWSGRAGLKIRGDLNVYLYTAIRNRTFTAGRHATVVARMEADVQQHPDTMPAAGTVSDPQTALESAEVDTVMSTLLASVSTRDREVLVLRWFDQMTYADIAAALGLSLSQVRTILTRNEARLLVALEQSR